MPFWLLAPEQVISDRPSESSLHIRSPAITQNSEWSENPHTEFFPLTYAQTPAQLPLSGSFSTNPTCLSSFEFQSQSLHHNEASLLCWGSTPLCYNSRVPKAEKPKYSCDSHLICSLYLKDDLVLFTHQFQTTAVPRILFSFIVSDFGGRWREGKAATSTLS